MRRCGNCGQPGHNRRTCKAGSQEIQQQNEKILEEEAQTIEQPAKPRKPKKPKYICPLCGDEDKHKEKNCPYQPPEDESILGPDKLECGHFSWWLRDGECDLCGNRMFKRAADAATNN